MISQPPSIPASPLDHRLTNRLCYDRSQLLSIQPSQLDLSLSSHLQELGIGFHLSSKRSCRGGKRKQRKISVVSGVRAASTTSNDVRRSPGTRACIVIGSLFLVSGLLLVGKSMHSMITEVHQTKAVLLYTTFALTTGVVAVIMALVKIYLGYKLESEAMATDSIITIVGAAMSFAGVAGLELYVQNTHLWFMDSVFGIICGVFLVGFGIKLLYEMLNKKKGDHLELK